MVVAWNYRFQLAASTRLLSIIVILLSALAIIVLLTNTGEDALLSQSLIIPVSTASSQSHIDQGIITFESISATNNAFNASSNDVLVLLHIQKTGGTAFERHLVQDLGPQLNCSCTSEKRRCNCPRPSVKKRHSPSPPVTLADTTWLISRFSTGWVCGLHPDYTQLEECLSRLKVKLYFLTFLRHPLHRFVSEFRHVQRGATWKASKSHCKQYDTQLCYKSQPHWSNVSLEEFLSCPNNMAINRQTKMLANYKRDESGMIKCDESQAEQDRLLESAMANLRRIAFFGICEQQKASQLVFEKTFKLEFSNEFSQSEDNKTRVFISKLSSGVVDKIVELNSLDMRLYEYALDLFKYRCNQLVNNNECNDG
uniref:Heparan-sulfate 6-O-sulfotransferase n=1 Tax=Aceria tosichella TaxID=561515 RepID=A0A6G1S857_9ACAR